MYNKTLRPSVIPVLVSMLILPAVSCTGSQTVSEIAFLAFSALFGIVVVVLAVTLFLTLVGSMVVFLLRSSRTRATGPDTGHTGWHIGLMAASIALFGILISGVFVFMTLQINTTAERAAATTAARTSADTARATAMEVARKQMDEIRPVLVLEAQKTARGLLNVVADAPTSEQHGAGAEDGRTCSDTAYRFISDSVDQDVVEQTERTTCTTLGAEKFPIGSPYQVTLQELETKRLCFEVEERANYRIEAISTRDGDPAVALYQWRGGLVHGDDDGGEGLNSCFEIELLPGAYLLEVEDVLGQADTHMLSVQELPTVNPGG